MSIVDSFGILPVIIANQGEDQIQGENSPWMRERAPGELTLGQGGETSFLNHLDR